MKRAALLVLLAACHREVKQEVHVTAQDDSKTVSTTQKEEVKTQAESEVSTKTEHEDDALVVQDPDGTIEVAQVPKGQPITFQKGARVIGTVPLTKTKTDKDSRIGAKADAVNSDALTTATSDKALKSDSKTATSTDVGPGLKFYGFLLLAIVLLMVGGFCYLKFIVKVGWL